LQAGYSTTPRPLPHREVVRLSGFPPMALTELVIPVVSTSLMALNHPALPAVEGSGEARGDLAGRPRALVASGAEIASSSCQRRERLSQSVESDHQAFLQRSKSRPRLAVRISQRPAGGTRGRAGRGAQSCCARFGRISRAVRPRSRVPAPFSPTVVQIPDMLVVGFPGVGASCAVPAYPGLFQQG